MSAISFPPSYQTTFTPEKRLFGTIAAIVAISVVAIFVVGYVLLLFNHLASFPQDVASLFTEANIVPLVGAGAGFVLFMSGVAFVFHRALHRKHEKLEASLGILDLNKLKEVALTVDGRQGQQLAYLDRSTLDEKGNGRAYLYNFKNYGNHYIVSTCVPIGCPFYLIQDVALSLIQVVVPIEIEEYVITGEVKWIALADLPQKIASSLLRAVTAPFYATAYFFAALSSLVFPMQGRVAAFAIEYDWKGGKTRRESPTMATCWHPIGVAECTNGGTTKGESLSGKYQYNIAMKE